MAVKIREVEAGTIMSKSGIPGIAWVVNPYMGCRFGCKYCYAFYVGRFRHPVEEWGTYVDVKVNAAELFEKELKNKLKRLGTADVGEIFFSSVTDPYQGVEAKYQLTRKCLKVLVDAGYEGKVSVLTKSHLVTRDIDLFGRLKQVDVGLTITSMGDPITRYLETYAPPHEERIKALKQLDDAGIKTYAFIGPLLPHYVWQEKELDRLFGALGRCGVWYIFLEHINLRKYIRDRLFEHLRHDHPELIEQYEKAMRPEYREALDELVLGLARKHKLKIAGNSTIHHPDSGGWVS